MSQRNPMNERYQQAEEKTGKTRRSAASARPVTKAASSVRIQSTSKQPKRRGLLGSLADSSAKSANSDKDRQREARAQYYNPDTPEYKLWRRIWWASIIMAVAFTFLAFFTMNQPGSMGYYFLGVGYAMLIASILIDVVKVRKIRKQYAASMTGAGSRSKEATAARKAQKAEEKREQERLREEAAKKAAEKAAKKEARKGGGLLGFGKKKETAEAAADEAAQAAASDKKAKG